MKTTYQDYSNYLYYFGLAIVIGLILFGAYQFGSSLKRNIKGEEEIELLKKEKLRLEIQILKRENEILKNQKAQSE